jgi:transcriptional antiterminator RfaH
VSDIRSDEARSDRWFVVRTKPRQETRAELNLRGWGLDVLAPKVREPQYRAERGTSYSIVPLFPSYVFARFDPLALSKVRQTRGVHSVVGLGEYATAVDDSIVEHIRSRIQNDGFVRMEDPAPGDPIRIVSGPLRTFTGIFSERRGRDRAVILLGLIGTQTPVDVAMDSIRKTIT